MFRAADPTRWATRRVQPAHPDRFEAHAAVMVSRDRLDEWVHELRLRALVCRAEAESFGEQVVVAHCDDVLARLDVVRVPLQRT